MTWLHNAKMIEMLSVFGDLWPDGVLPDSVVLIIDGLI